MKLKLKISIYHRYHLEWFPKCIERYWFMGSRAKKKVYDFRKIKNILELGSHEFLPC